MKNIKNKIDSKFEQYKKNIEKRYIKFKNDTDIKFSSLKYKYIEISIDDIKNIQENFIKDINDLVNNIDEFNLNIVNENKDEDTRDKIINYLNSNISSKITNLANNFKNDAANYLIKWSIKNDLCHNYNEYNEQCLRNKFNITKLNIENYNLKLKNKMLTFIIGLLLIITFIDCWIYYKK